MALPIANVAKYELTLPSQQKTIQYRPFLVKEEKILLMALESGKPEEMLTAVKDIVKSCTFEAINPEDYPLFDLEYIFLQIRAKSVGEVAKIRILCPDDKKTYENVEVDLSKVEVYVDDNLSNNIVLDETRKLGVVLKYPSLKDVERFAEHGDESIQSAMKMITACIDSIFDADNLYDAKNETVEALDKFIDSLNNEQFTKLSEFFKEMPALHSTISFNCTSCNHANSEELRGLQSFFT